MVPEVVRARKLLLVQLCFSSENHTFSQSISDKVARHHSQITPVDHFTHDANNASGKPFRLTYTFAQWCAILCVSRHFVLGVILNSPTMKAHPLSIYHFEFRVPPLRRDLTNNIFSCKTYFTTLSFLLTTY